ncbi:MAG: YheT family hydrolase [Planctomycetota bacterium]
MSAPEFLPPFTPSRWLANRHFQTFLGTTLRRDPPLPALRRQRIELADGDFVDVDLAAARDRNRSGSWVLVLHGLEGSSRSRYVRGLAAALLATGNEVCLMNYRGCSGEPNRLPGAYHGGATADVLAVLEQLSAERPGRTFAAVGFSIGANMLMKLLGEDPELLPAGLVATVAISAPFDLESCMHFLDRPSRTCGIYRRQLLKTLRTKALDKLDRFPGCIAASPADVRATRTFAAFDELYTAPIHGFRDATDYWRCVSGAGYLSRIALPMLIISAGDDPFFPRGYVPQAAIAANPHLTLALTRRGGHCGFVGGSAWAPAYWADRAAVGYLARRFSPTSALP